MKFSVDRTQLHTALTKVSYALPAKLINETLKSFVFEVENGALSITATDTQTTIQAVLDVFDTEESNFRAILPSDKMLYIAKNAHDGELTLDIAPKKAVITSRTSEWMLNLLDASKYPNVVLPKDVPWKPVNRVPFLESLLRVSAAASFDVSSPGLCMVNVSNNIFQASDRARMHQVESEYGVPDVSIPSFSVKTLTSLLKMSQSEQFSLVRGKNGYMAKIDGLVLTVAGLVAEFPDISGSLLKPTLVNNIEVVVDTQDLLKAIKRTRVTVDSVTKMLSVKVTPSKLTVSTKEEITNSRASERLEVGYSGNETVEANVNVFHMIDALTHCPVSTATLTFGKREGTKLPSVRLVADDGMYNVVMSQTRTDII